jgi:putative ABC transport system permease protein
VSAGAWVASWRASLRMARREVVRHRARNALIVGMLALPVFGTVTVDTVVHSAQRSVAEKLTREMGQATALVQNDHSPVYQTPDGSQWAVLKGPAEQRSHAQTAALLTSLLPGATVLSDAFGIPVTLHTPDGFISLSTEQLDLTNPALTGKLDLRSGRWPLSADEILLSAAAQQQLGTKVGESVTVPSRSGRFLVVGIADNPEALNAPTVYALPNALSDDAQNDVSWLVVDPAGVPWSAVRQLNADGLLVVSRTVIANPPPQSQVPYYAYTAAQTAAAAPSSGRINQAAVTAAAIATVVVGLILLEVVLLAGPAFAVSARRRQREYAVIGAAGASGTHLRRMVLADGVVLGAVAGLAGAALGVGAAAAAMPLVPRLTHQVPGAFQVKPLEVLAATLLSLLLGTAAAWMPARAVARQDILLSLTGRRPPRAAQWRLPTGGLVLVGTGLAAIYAGPHEQNLSLGALILVLGVAMLDIGAIMCTPVLVGVLARFGRLLPLGPRLALRDGARHRGRTTPAVAAMFAAVAGAVAAGTWLVSTEAQDRARYVPTLLPNQVAVPLDSGRLADQAAAALRTVLPVTGMVVAPQVDAASPGSQQQAMDLVTVAGACPREGVGGFAVMTDGDGLCEARDSAGGIEGPQIGDGRLLTEITGIDDPAATRMLGRGGAVVFDPTAVRSDGTAVFRIDRYQILPDGTGTEGDPSQGSSMQKTTTDVTLPAVYVDVHGRPDPGYLVSPAAAQKLGLRQESGSTLILDLAHHVTPLELQRANRALAQLDIQETVIAENGYQSKLGLANAVLLAVAVLVAVGAAGIATGLSIADGQPDHETLSAVGGSPLTRRLLAGSTALIVTGLGAVIGVPIGFAIVGGLLHLRSFGLSGVSMSPYSGTASVAMTVPWLNLAVAILGVPLLTAAGAMLFTRSQVRLSRRIG